MSWSRVEIERRYGQVYGHSGDEYKVQCTNCGTKAMWVNVKKRVLYCFSCGISEHLRDHVISGSMYHTVSAKKKEVVSVFPNNFKWFREIDNENLQHFHYIDMRGIDPKSVLWGISGDYCIFPIWKDKKVVYWQGRAIYPVKPKTKNPSKEVSGYGKSDLLYNYEDEHGVKPREYVLLVEGVFDALTVDGLAMMGKLVSEKQAKLISCLMPKKIYQVLDADANSDSYEENRKTLRKYAPFAPIIDVKLPEGDPNSLGQAVVWSLIYRSGAIKGKEVVHR